MILSPSSGVSSDEERISRSSSDARSPRSSRLFMPFSPKVTCISGVNSSIAARSSATPKSLRFLSNSTFLASRKFLARPWSSVAVSSSKPSIVATSSLGTKATSSTEVKPSATNSWASNSSTSSVSTNSAVLCLNSS